MIDLETCNSAEATLSDAIGQLMEAGHELAIARPAEATLVERAHEIGAIAADIGVLARALEAMQRRADRRRSHG